MTAEVVSLLEVRQRRLKRPAIAIMADAGLPAFVSGDPNAAILERLHGVPANVVDDGNCDGCPCEMNPDNLA